MRSKMEDFSLKCMTRFIFALLILHGGQGCSPLPQCGFTPAAIHLTTVPGTVHVDVAERVYCIDTNGNDIEQAGRRTTVEIDAETGDVRYSEDEFKAERTYDPVPFSAQDTVDQNFSVDHDKENGKVIVTYFDNYMRSVPVIEHYFSIPDSEEIYFSFVGEQIFETFYFVYKKTDSSVAVAVCGVIDEECVESDAPPELSDFEVYDFDESILVYSSLNLVAFPLLCCVCRDYEYFIFNSEGIERNLENFNYVFQAYNADPRVMHAYSAYTDGDGSIELRYNSLTTNEKIVREVSTAEIEEAAMTLYTSTTFNATDLAQGTMFDIVANTHIIVKGMDIHLASTETHEVSVYFRKGSNSFVNVMRHPGAWELVVNMEAVQGAGAGSATPLPVFPELSIAAGMKQGIYVTLASGKYMGLTSSNTATGDVYSPSENENVGISVGVAKDGGIFLYTTKNMVFNGKIYYVVDESKALDSSPAFALTQEFHQQHTSAILFTVAVSFIQQLL